MITSSQIRAARAMINAKQSELAKAAGISLATLNNIERGVGDPRISTLEAIEEALSRAGISLSSDATTDSVSLQRLTRPNAYDTFFASQRVLEALGPNSLLKPRHVLLFARWNRKLDEARPRVCLLIEGQARAILYDQVDFNLDSGARAAEVAGIILAAFAFQRGHLHYLDEMLEDTTAAEDDETVRRLRSMRGRPLRHPSEFIDVFDSWERCLSAYGARAGHPMGDLDALFAPRPEEAVEPDEPSEFEEPSVPDDPGEPDEPSGFDTFGQPNEPEEPIEVDAPREPDDFDEPDEPIASDQPPERI